MIISTIRLANIRGFRDLTIPCGPKEDENGSVTLIIGENGTGKTTLLRAVALALCDLPDANALIAEPIGGLVSAGKTEGDILLMQGGRTNLHEPVTDNVNIFGQRLGRELHIAKLEDDSPETVHFDETQTNTAFVSNLVCGYGVGRTGGQQTSLNSRRVYRIMDSVRSLFDYTYGMQNPELTLRRLRDYVGTDNFNRYSQAIKLSLGLTEADEIVLRDGGGIVVRGETVGRPIPLEALADGYRATFNWIIDIFGWAIQDRFRNELHGTLLIDEVEQHLHPSLQVEVLPRLRQLFPNMQIIATTHSPLVALGVKPEEVVVLRRNQDGEIAVQPTPDFSGYSAEDMLEDERIFNTKKVYTLETSRKRAEYHQLIQIPGRQRTVAQTNRMRTLARELRRQQLPEFRQPLIDPEVQRILQQYQP